MAGKSSGKGGKGNKIKGTNADDDLIGTSGNDKLIGKNGDDILVGAAGDDILNGNSGNDTLDGDSGDDKLAGNAGDDTLDGGSGNDRLQGNSGNDVLAGGAGDDDLKAGSGDDLAVYVASENDGATDRYDGGSGIDSLLLDLTSDEWMRDDVQADIANFLAFIEAHTDPETGETDGEAFQFSAFDLTVRKFEDLRVTVDGVEIDPRDEAVTENDDTVPEESIVRGNGPDDDVLVGTSGNDKLIGKAGDDTLIGAAGDDKLIGNSGTDTLDGGPGDDKMNGNSGDDIMDGGAGNDRLHGNGGDDVLDGGSGNDNLKAGGGDDLAIYVAAENAGAKDIYAGGSGSDSLLLELTGDEWLRDDVQTDIKNYLTFLVAHTDPETGEADGEAFQFSAFDLTVREFENLRVTVDGVELDPRANIDPVANNDGPGGYPDDKFSTDEDTPLTILAVDLLANDIDDDGDSLSVTAVANGIGGSVSLDIDGNVLFSPDADFSGDAGFTYSISDGRDGTATAAIGASTANDTPPTAARWVRNS